jgi:hypothetical protein
VNTSPVNAVLVIVTGILFSAKVLFAGIETLKVFVLVGSDVHSDAQDVVPLTFTVGTGTAPVKVTLNDAVPPSKLISVDSGVTVIEGSVPY